MASGVGIDVDVLKSEIKKTYVTFGAHGTTVKAFRPLA